MTSFWKDKNVFVTGHTGFKGGWLSLWLSTLGAKVTGYALAPTTQYNLFSLAKIDSHVCSYIEDIRNLAFLKKTVVESEPAIIFHLAAQPLVRASYTYPVDTYATNVMGTVNILEAFREAKTAKVLINITTDKCYDNKEWHWGYRENDPLGGYDPYSSSKACAELVTAAYRSSYLNPVDWPIHQKAIATVRAGNVFGGGDWSEDRLIPDVVMALLENKQPLIRHPKAVRPWQHVLEPLYGYLMLAERMWDSSTYSDSWNFGPREEGCKPVEYLVRELCSGFGQQTNWVESADASLHEATFLKLDTSKVHSRLGWRPILTLNQGLALTTDWYKAWAKGAAPFNLTLDQIAFYTTQLEREHA